MKIGELAKKSGCQVVTIRYYEKEGLLQPPERSEGNYRIYSQEDLDTLRFIRHCRLHGINLAEIRELLAFKARPTQNCEWITLLVEKHIRSVDEQIASLQHLREHLLELSSRCRGGKGAGCGILRSLEEDGDCPYCHDFQCRLKLQDKGQDRNRAQEPAQELARDSRRGRRAGAPSSAT